jgi:hypothetical protein
MACTSEQVSENTVTLCGDTVQRIEQGAMSGYRTRHNEKPLPALAKHSAKKSMFAIALLAPTRRRSTPWSPL